MKKFILLAMVLVGVLTGCSEHEEENYTLPDDTSSDTLQAEVSHILSEDASSDILPADTSSDTSQAEVVE